MRQRHNLWLLLLILLALLVSSSCVICGVSAWWLYSSGRLARWLEVVRPDRVVPPRQGGELRLSGAEPVTLDPALVEDSFSAVYVVEIFSGLVTLDRNLEVVPDLAERWEVSQDGRTYTFYLRPDARFQDGRPVTAEDFKYSLERACSPELASPVARSYLGDIEGVPAFMEGRAQEISGIRVLDDHKLALTIDAPKAYFLAKLTYSTAFVVDRANVATGEKWTEHPNGTGPFRLVQWDQEKIVLAPNEHYYGQRAALDRVTFVLSGGAPVTMYENNQLDITEVGLADIERVQDPSNPLHEELTVVPQLDVQYLAMDVRQPPFDDVKVRQAVAHAIDRQRLANVVLQKTVVAAEGILPPGMPGYEPEFKGLAFDPEQARQCLQESKYKDAANLPEIVLHISGTEGTLPPAIEAIVAMLQTNLGVEVKVEQTPWRDFLADLNAGRYAFYTSGWIADYPDPQNFLDQQFHSQSHDNRTGYQNPEVDRWLEEARIEQNRERRLQLYRQAEERIVQDAVWVPLWHGRNYMLTKPYVKGAVYSAAIRPWLRDVYLER